MAKPTKAEIKRRFEARFAALHKYYGTDPTRTLIEHLRAAATILREGPDIERELPVAWQAHADVIASYLEDLSNESEDAAAGREIDRAARGRKSTKGAPLWLMAGMPIPPPGRPRDRRRDELLKQIETEEAQALSRGERFNRAARARALCEQQALAKNGGKALTTRQRREAEREAKSLSASLSKRKGEAS